MTLESEHPQIRYDEDMRVSIEKIPAHLDNRGVSFDVIGEHDLSEWPSIHAAITIPGAVRGNHVHDEAEELLVVSGPALVRLRVDGETSDVEVSDGEIVRLRIPAGVAHAVQGTGDHPGYLVALNSTEDLEARREILIQT